MSSRRIISKVFSSTYYQQTLRFLYTSQGLTSIGSKVGVSVELDTGMSMADAAVRPRHLGKRTNAVPHLDGQGLCSRSWYPCVAAVAPHMRN